MRLTSFLAIAIVSFVISACSKEALEVPEPYFGANVQALQNVSSRSWPNGPMCNQLKSGRWENVSLYDLTYGCLPRGWESFFSIDSVKRRIYKISTELEKEIRAGNQVEPQIGNVFKAFYMVQERNVKAVILGQDPAPQRSIAMGLAFSTKKGVKSGVTPSIQRVLLSAQNQGYKVDLDDAYLGKWAQRGTLLVNMALTIGCPKGNRSCKIASHLSDWKPFTEELYKHLNRNNNPKAFVFWGGSARAFSKYIKNANHKVIAGGHPSPAGAPHGRRFFCRGYFTKVNDWLQKNNRAAINWDLVSNPQPARNACYWTWHRATRTSSCHRPC